MPQTTPYPAEPNPHPIDPGVTIGHVHLKAADLTVIEAFYVGILGFAVMARYPGALFLAAGNYHHHLAFNTWDSAGGTPPPHTTGLYHTAIKYPTKSALADALRRLMAARYPLEGTSDHGTQLALYLRDPEQNGVELYWDRPQSKWPLTPTGTLTFTNHAIDLDALLATP